MSSPDFPGSSWQEPEPFDDTGLYRETPSGGTGRGDGYAEGYAPGNGYAPGGRRASAGGHRARRAARAEEARGYNAGQGYDGGYDRGGYNGNGHSDNGYNGNGANGSGYGSNGHGANGYRDRGYGGGEYGAGGYPDGGNGQGRNEYDDGGGRRSGGYRGSRRAGGRSRDADSYGANGSGAGGYGAGGNGANGYGAGDYGAAAYAGQSGYGAAGVADGAASRGADYGYGGDSEYADRSRLDRATGRVGRALGGRGGGRGPGGYGPDGPDGPDGPEGPDDSRGLGRITGGIGRFRTARGYADPDGKPPRDTGNWLQRQWHARWWRHWTWKKAGMLTGITAAVVVLAMVAGFFVVYTHYQLPLKELSKPLIQSSEVYYSDGKTPVGCFCSQNRAVLTPAQLAQDKYLEPAFFAAEDRNYLNEGGISITGTARALLVDLSGSGYQGGSTITEQFIKSYLLPSGIGNLTTKQKLEEIILAIKLSKRESKSWILTHYLNEINLGWAYGVQAAAETYFGKPAWKLDVEQCAMLASMVQYPAFDPRNPTAVVPLLGESLLSRWVAVLGNMARPAANTYGITQQQLAQILPVANPTSPSQLKEDLKNFPKISDNQNTGGLAGYRGYIMYDVERELENTYGFTQSQLDSDGLRIVTTISKAKMDALYATVHEAKVMMKQDGRALPIWAHIGAVLENPATGAIEAVYEGPNYTAQPYKYCLAIRCQYPMATVSRNQVGSSFKPYVLAAAVQQNMNVQTSILNGYSPICVPPETMPLVESKRGPASSCPASWLPVSYDPVVEGPVSVVKAAALSSNAAFEDLAHRVGTGPIIKLAQSFGVNIASTAQGGSNLTNDVGQVGIALGIAPLTVEEQANTFATLADSGIYHTPHFIAKITENGGQRVPLKVYTHAVLNQTQTADVDWALSFDTKYGTAFPNGVLTPARPTIAKTGTTNVAQSAFFIGALPQQYSFAVGMFTNSQNNQPGGQTLDDLPGIGGIGGGYGGAWPATIWRLYMTKLLAMSPKPISQLAPLNVAGFVKWVQVTAPKKKCKQAPGQPGFPFFGHGHGGNGNSNCQNGGSPSPSPSPSPSGSPSPSPSPSGSPSPSPSFPPFAKTTSSTKSSKQGRHSAASIPSLTTAAVLNLSVGEKPGWAPSVTGLA